MITFRSTPTNKAVSAEIFQSLDQEAISSEIRNTIYNMPTWAWEIAADMVYRCAEKYLARDVVWMDIIAIEQRFEWQNESGVYDLRGKFTDAADDWLKNKTFVRDWKTCGGALDESWVQRYTNSHQWRIYLYNSGADVFIFTGITRDGTTRDIYLKRPDNLEEQVRSQMLGLNAMSESLLTIGAQTFPLNQPHACFAFGRRCEYREQCSTFTMPRGTPTPWNWSPSAIDAFLLCPERFRRDRLVREAGQAHESSQNAEIGLAVHRGLAEIYRQAWGIQAPAAAIPAPEEVSDVAD